MVFRLTKILRPEEFGQANYFGAIAGRVPNELNCPRKIILRFGAASHLHERGFGQFRLGHL
jgi:hypothetical protein